MRIIKPGHEILTPLDGMSILKHLESVGRVCYKSEDRITKATFMNAFAFIMLQKRIADELDVEVGTYTHRANSFHCYERDYDLLQKYVNSVEKSIAQGHLDDIAYEYENFYKEMMDESIPEIEAMVASLRKQSN